MSCTIWLESHFARAALNKIFENDSTFVAQCLDVHTYAHAWVHGFTLLTKIEVDS